MKLLLVATVGFFGATYSAHASWSCINKQGTQMTCESPVYCQKYYPACVKVMEIEESESTCQNPRCAKPGEEGKKENEKKAATKSSPVVSAKWENVVSLAFDRIDLVKAAIEKANAKVDSPRPPSGLSPEEEQRLFGNNGSEPAPKPVWAKYLSEAAHKKLEDELRRNKLLREELRKQVLVLPTKKPVDKEAKVVLSTILKEVDSGLLLEPLTSKEAFELDEQDVDELKKRGATK